MLCIQDIRAIRVMNSGWDSFCCFVSFLCLCINSLFVCRKLVARMLMVTCVYTLRLGNATFCAWYDSAELLRICESANDP